MGHWVQEPHEHPNRCFLTHTWEQKDAPFYRSEKTYMEPFVQDGEIRVRPNVCRFYLSGLALREVCDSPGSPFVLVERQEHEHLLRRLAEQDEEILGLQDQLEDLEAQSADKAALDAKQVANELAEVLDLRYARKTGPKPGRAA